MENASVVKHALEPHAVDMRDMSVPAIGPDDVLVQVGAVGVCGSDLHMAHNTHSWPMIVPCILGHEFAGTVARVGKNVKDFAEGDRVACETAAQVCGTCALCRQGRYNLCPQRKGFGASVHGAMTSYVRVPARVLHRLPAGLPFYKAALAEPCCVAYHAVCVNADVKPGDVVVVLGPGPIGLLCACMADLCGAVEVIVAGLGRDQKRLALAPRIGVTRTVNIEREDLTDLVRASGDGLGAHLVIDAAGVSATLATAVDLVRPDGRISKVGWGPEPIDVSLDPLVLKNASIQGSFSHTYVMWEKVLHLLAADRIPADVIAGLKAPLPDWQNAFDTMDRGEVIKSVLVPETSEEPL